MFDSFGYVSYSPHTKVAEFASHLEQGRLSGSRCLACGHFSFPPRADCPGCFEGAFELVSLSGRGKVETYCTISAAPAGFEGYVPYTIGVVALEEGGRLLAWFGESVNEEDVAIALEVQVVPRQFEGGQGKRYVYSLEMREVRA